MIFKNHNWLFIFLFLVLSNQGLFSNNILKNFLIKFKNLEYSEAKKIAINLKDTELQNVCLSLVNIQENRGQNPEKLILKADNDSYTGITQIVNYLNKGYYHLYKTPFKPYAYNFFQQAYQLSNEKNEIPELTKICLLAILEVYSKELYKVSEDRLSYLKTLKVLSTDLVDEYYYYLNFLDMYLRDEPSTEFPVKELIEKLNLLMENLDKSKLLFAQYYLSVGVYYRFTTQKRKAIRFYKSAIEISKNHIFLKGIYFSSLAQMAETNRELGNLKLTGYYLNEAEKNMSQVDTLASSYGLNIYKSFYHYDLKNYRKAYDLFKKASIQNLKIDYRKNASEISRLNVQYQTEKKEKELLKTRTKKVETELALSKSKNWIYTLLAFLAIVGGVFLFIYQRNKQKAQQEITAEKERGLQALILAQEEERNTIARELHDGVVQEIGSVILKSRNFLTKKDLIQDTESKEVLKSLEDSNKSLRTISHQMMPRALKELGIIPALNDLLEGSLALVNIKYTLEHFNIKERLAEKIEITIYRITQELINNIIKHSKADTVSVQLFNSNNTIILMVEDNGVGFSSKTSKKGIGLLNISSRLDMVKGNVNFDLGPKSGTLVTIKIPL